MYQAITVKYLPSTNTKPARYRASCQAGFCYISSNDDPTREVAAAIKLANRFGWSGVYFGGRLVNDDAVFVLVDPSKNVRFEII